MFHYLHYFRKKLCKSPGEYMYIKKHECTVFTTENYTLTFTLTFSGSLYNGLRVTNKGGTPLCRARWRYLSTRRRNLSPTTHKVRVWVSNRPNCYNGIHCIWIIPYTHLIWLIFSITVEWYTYQLPTRYTITNTRHQYLTLTQIYSPVVKFKGSLFGADALGNFSNTSS